MHGPIFAILALVLSAAATASVAQGTGQETLSADPRTRCTQLVAFWQRPIYAGRFNMDKRKPLAEERIDL